MNRIRDLRGRRVAITGNCSIPRAELIQRIKRHGGCVSGERAEISNQTNILVRGASPFWKHGSFGTKEERAADLIRAGFDLSVILSEDLDRLLRGKTVIEQRYIAGSDVDELRADAVLAKQFADLGALDAPAIVWRRLEQAHLRHLHFGDRLSVPCSLCGRRLPTYLLVVGHIKPRARCSSSEKRDLQNVAMPICLVGCDILFERGFVAVSKTGRVVTSNACVRSKDFSSLLSRLRGRRCPQHTPSSEPYFAWHREFVFHHKLR